MENHNLSCVRELNKMLSRKREKNCKRSLWLARIELLTRFLLSQENLSLLQESNLPKSHYDFLTRIDLENKRYSYLLTRISLPSFTFDNRKRIERNWYAKPEAKTKECNKQESNSKTIIDLENANLPQKRESNSRTRIDDEKKNLTRVSRVE